MPATNNKLWVGLLKTAAIRNKRLSTKARIAFWIACLAPFLDFILPNLLSIRLVTLAIQIIAFVVYVVDLIQDWKQANRSEP